MIRRLILIATTLFAASAGYAQDVPNNHRYKNIEQAMETHLGALTLPATIPNAVFVSQCASCPSKLLKIEATTQFFINGKAVTYKNILALVGASDNSMTIFYDAGKETITRVLVLGASSNHK